MERGKERGVPNEQVEAWPLRDKLFASSIRGIYGDRFFNDNQIEKLRLHKLGEKKLSFLDMIFLAIKIKRAGVNEERQLEQIEEWTKDFSDQEKEVAQLVLGLNFCGEPMGKQAAAQTLGKTPEEIEQITLSCWQKKNMNRAL